MDRKVFHPHLKAKRMSDSLFLVYIQKGALLNIHVHLGESHGEPTAGLGSPVVIVG